SPKNENNLECALAEAAYLTGLERNADVVRMASYAPLFAHVDGWQWTPDLIWVDNLSVVATPNYYVQQLFSRNRGDRVLPTRIENSTPAPSGATGETPTLFASAALEKMTSELILKVVNSADSASQTGIRIDTAAKISFPASAVVLTGSGPEARNIIGQPRNVTPLETAIPQVSKEFQHVFPANSMTVIRLKLQ